MAYPFVPSGVDLGLAKGPRLAMVWHMAQGGGTVSYLSKPNPNGVSVHFVIEYDGDIIQMLRLDHMHSSIRTSDIRTGDDKPFQWNGETVTYGQTAAKEVLGKWADTKDSLGPNHATIAVEIEGTADVGPNTKQTLAIGRLAASLGIPANLCHRDFQDYKPCPGHQFPWTVVGGHGASSEDSTVTYAAPDTHKDADCPTGMKLYNDIGCTQVGTTLGGDRWLPYYGSPASGVRLVAHADRAWYAKATEVRGFRDAPVPDCPPGGSGTINLSLNGETLYEAELP